MKIKWKYHLARLFFYASTGATLGHLGVGLDNPAFWAIMLCMIGSVVVTGWEATEIFKKELDDFMVNMAKTIDGKDENENGYK